MSQDPVWSAITAASVHGSRLGALVGRLAELADDLHDAGAVEDAGDVREAIRIIAGAQR